MNLFVSLQFGNTCYCNSVLQALYFCRPFREKVLAYKVSYLSNLVQTGTKTTSTDSSGLNIQIQITETVDLSEESLNTVLFVKKYSIEHRALGIMLKVKCRF